MSIFRLSHSKIFLQFLVPQKISIFTLGPSFKVNPYVKVIFFNKILQKIHNIVKITPNKFYNFLTKHKLNINFLP